MTVNDVLKISNSDVYVMDRDTVFQIVAKFKDDITKIAMDYDMQDVLSRPVIDILASDCKILLTVSMGGLYEEYEHWFS